MTLETWASENGAYVKEFSHPQYAPMKVIADRSYPDMWGLYHLTDYVITSVQAGSIWLAHR